MRDVFQVDLPLRSLFEAPTIAGLSEHVAAAFHASKLRRQSPLCRCSRDQALPLAFSQERMWLVHQLQPESSAYNIPVAIRLQGLLDVRAMEDALDELVARHEILRTTIATVNGRPVQRIAPKLDLTLAIADLSSLAFAEREAEATKLCQEHAKLPFDLATGPLLRASLSAWTQRIMCSK